MGVFDCIFLEKGKGFTGDKAGGAFRNATNFDADKQNRAAAQEFPCAAAPAFGILSSQFIVAAISLYILDDRHRELSVQPLLGQGKD